MRTTRDVFYLFFRIEGFFVSLSSVGHLVLGGGALVLLLVAVQDLAAAFGDPLDGRVGFLGAVLHLERAFDGSGRRAQEKKTVFPDSSEGQRKESRREG